MRSVPALIVVIIGIVAIIAVIGFVIASFTLDFGKSKTTDPTDLKTTSPIPEISNDMFILQLFASQNYSRIEHQKQKLEKAGYKTIVTKIMKDGEILYRLRLEGIYGKNEAWALGDEIKRKFPSIQNFWLDQIGTEESVSEHIAQEELIEIEKPVSITELATPPQETQKISVTSVDTQYEVQLMASSNYAKIEEAKSALTRLGYETKIVNLQEGNKIVYRLRLKDMYTKERGIALGERLIKESSLISGYWLDEIKDGKSLQTQTPITRSVEIQPAVKPASDNSQKIFEVQLLANTKYDVVADRKRELENKGYPAKILTVLINGKTYYRLRLADSFTKSEAQNVGEDLKKKVAFVKDFWIVQKTKEDVEITSPPVIKESPPSVRKTEVPPVATEISSPQIKQETIKKVDYSATCNSNSVDIYTGPDTGSKIDPIGKLMQGITVFVVEERGDWARFTITPNDESWSGWVKLNYLDKN